MSAAESKEETAEKVPATSGNAAGFSVIVVESKEETVKRVHRLPSYKYILEFPDERPGDVFYHENIWLTTEPEGTLPEEFI